MFSDLWTNYCCCVICVGIKQHIIKLLSSYFKYKNELFLNFKFKNKEQSISSGMAYSTLIKGKDDSQISYTLRFDGGAAPTNPGPCAGAFVIFNEKGRIIHEGGEYFENGTNNYGEYSGLILGLKKCITEEIKDIHIEGDSLLVISQISDKWKVRNEGLKILFTEAKDLLKNFNNVSVKHILRGLNTYADKLSDKTIKLKKSW